MSIANVKEHIQRGRPFGDIEPRRVYYLPVDQIRPVVRIAHRQFGPLHIAERIIFDYEFVLIVHGSGELDSNGESVSYSANDLLLIPPFASHAFLTPCSERCEHIAVHFDISARVPPYAEEVDQRTPYEVRLTDGLELPAKVRLPQSGEIQTLLEGIVRNSDWANPLNRLSVSSDLTRIIVLLLRNHGNNRTLSPTLAQNRARVTNLVAFIQENLAQELTAEQLAEHAEISVSRLNTIFRQETGRSPLEYVRMKRVEKARELLADRSLSIKNIAAMTGFADVYHFSKVFRRVDGLSPTHYRAALISSRGE